jgi:hypothetical protein
MEYNSVHDSYFNYKSLAVQPLFNHKILEKLDGFKDIYSFFSLLQDYLDEKAKFSQNKTLSSIN